MYLQKAEKYDLENKRIHTYFFPQITVLNVICIARGDSLVVEEVEHKNILIVLIAVCPRFSAIISSCL